MTMRHRIATSPQRNRRLSRAYSWDSWAHYCDSWAHICTVTASTCHGCRKFFQLRMKGSKRRICFCVFGSGHACRCSRNGLGDKIRLNAPRQRCKEWRRRAHCKCGRRGIATGLNAPKGKQPTLATASSQPSEPEAAAVLQAAPRLKPCCRNMQFSEDMPLPPETWKNMQR